MHSTAGDQAPQPRRGGELPGGLRPAAAHRDHAVEGVPPAVGAGGLPTWGDGGAAGHQGMPRGEPLFIGHWATVWPGVVTLCGPQWQGCG